MSPMSLRFTLGSHINGPSSIEQKQCESSSQSWVSKVGLQDYTVDFYQVLLNHTSFKDAGRCYINTFIIENTFYQCYKILQNKLDSHSEKCGV